MILHRFGERAENNSHLGKLGLESCGHGDAIEHRIHGDAREHLLFGERNAQLFVCAQNFRIQFVQAVQTWFLLWCGVVRNLLIIDGWVMDIGPLRFGLRFFQRFPMPERLQSPFKHEFRLVLLRGDQANDVFVQAFGSAILTDIGDESPLVLLLR